MADALAELKVILGADISDYEKKMDAVTKAQMKMGKDLEKIGKELSLKITLPILATAAAFTKMAAEEEAADFRLAASLRNVGINYAAVDASIHKTISSMEDLSGFNDTDLQNSFTSLINITRDYEASLKALPVAADLARATGMDLEQASMTVGKAFEGNTMALRRFGIQLGEGAKGMMVLEELNRRFSGSAAAYGQSTEGSFLRMKNALENAAEAWGKNLLPVANTFMGLIVTIAGMVQRAAEAFGRLSPGVRAVAFAVLAAVAAFGPLVLVIGKLMIMWPAIVSLFAAGSPVVVGMTLLVAKALALGLVAAFIITNWQNFKNIFTSIALGVAGLFTYMGERVLAFVNLFARYIPGLGPMLKEAQTFMGTAAQGLGDSFSASADKIEGPMRMLGNTTDWLKAKFDEMALGIGLSVNKVPVSTGGALERTLSFMQRFTERMQAEGKDMAQGIIRSFAAMASGMISSIAMGTGNAQEMLMNFLINTFDSIAEWAIANAIMMSAFGTALQESFGNPYVAAGIAVAMIALAAGMRASLQQNNQAALATGGMTTGRMSATIGDNPSGQELVMPLDSPVTTRALAAAMPEGGTAGSSITIIQEIDGREVARSVVPHMPGVFRLQSIGA